MASLLKFEMKCSHEDCGKVVVILVDPEDTEAPNLCPYCGSESEENK